MTSEMDLNSPKQKILFIGGLGRSGSTLVEKLLNELPTTFSVGETIHLWERGVENNERCGCSDLFSDCQHWQKVGDEAFNGWHNLDIQRVIDLRWQVDRSRQLGKIFRAHKSKKLSDEQKEYLYYMRSVLQASAKVAGNPEVLIESSKHLSTAALLALDPALDVRIVHIIRDPRGVAYSWTKQVKRPETQNEYMPTYRTSRSAFRWLSDNTGFDILARSQKTMQLRYEDFLESPKKSLTEIAALLELKDGNKQLDFLEGNVATLTTPMHSVAGNPLRFGSSTIELKLDNAWHDKLPTKEKKVVTALTAPLLRKYRYPLG